MITSDWLLPGTQLQLHVAGVVHAPSCTVFTTCAEADADSRKKEKA